MTDALREYHTPIDGVRPLGREALEHGGPEPVLPAFRQGLACRSSAGIRPARTGRGEPTKTANGARRALYEGLFGLPGLTFSRSQVRSLYRPYICR